MAKKTLRFQIDQDLYDSIHKLMGFTLIVNDVCVFKIHHGNNQEFYRRLLTEGVDKVMKDYQDVKQAYEVKYSGKDRNKDRK